MEKKTKFPNLIAGLKAAAECLIDEILHDAETVKRSKKWKVMKLDPSIHDKIKRDQSELREVKKLMDKYEKICW